MNEEFNKKVSEKEITGRRIFYKFLKDNKNINGIIKFKKGTYAPIDAQLTANTNITADIEIKTRSSMKYNDCILEKIKKDELMNYSDNVLKLYVAIYTDERKIIIWNLNEIDFDELPVDKMLLHKSTWGYGQNDYKEKEVYHLSFEKGKIYDI